MSGFHGKSRTIFCRSRLLVTCFCYAIFNLVRTTADDNVQHDSIGSFSQTVNATNVDIVLDSCYRGRYKSHTIVSQSDEDYGWGECAGFVDCPRGYYCIEGLKHACPAGTFANETKQYTNACSGICPSGYYCPVNTIHPIPCGVGNFCPKVVKSQLKLL